VVCLLSSLLASGSKYKVRLLQLPASLVIYNIYRSAGKGLFALHPSLTILYYRLLGAKIGKNVFIDPKTTLGEYDMLTFQDGCRIDRSHIRGFCVEREGYFRLDPINIGKCAVINTYTAVSPGATIPDSAVYGPHASSYDAPFAKSYAIYNRTLTPEPHWALQVLVAWPLIALVVIIARKLYLQLSGNRTKHPQIYPGCFVYGS
jgi:hypothetical protein